MEELEELKDSAYIIVCSDFHSAYGPFLGMESALKVAQVMTEKGECVYYPVILRVQSKVIFHKAEPIELDEKMTGGYL